MENTHNIKIKVENEANKDYENESYEEYSITTYVSCKQEDFSDCVGAEEPSPTTAQQKDLQGQTAIDNSQNADNNESLDTKLSCHNKKAIVTHFINNGWTSKSYRDLCKKIPIEKVEAYGKKTLSKAIEEAQQYVYQECESLCFGNITDWLEVFKTMHVPENSYYEPAIIMNAIVNNENHPDPEDIGGINLKAMYSFLCNGLMGLPQVQLDPISAKFLSNEFETLINEANSDVADSQTLVMKQKIERILTQRMDEVPPSLDPLWLTEGTIVHNDILDSANDFKIIQNDIITPINGTVVHNDLDDQKNNDTIVHNGNIPLTKEDTTTVHPTILNPKIESIQ